MRDYQSGRIQVPSEDNAETLEDLDTATKKILENVKSIKDPN